MADKQALNATFFAFRKRERSGVLTTTTIAYVVLCCITFGLFAFFNWSAVMDYIGWFAQLDAAIKSGDTAPTSSAFTPPASVMALGPMLLLLQLFYYVIAAAYEAACLKWMIRGESDGVFGFSFGADTWRIYFTYWIWFFLSLLFGIVFLIVAGGLMGSVFAFGAAAADASSMGGAAVVMFGVVAVLLLVVIYVCVRLAPAAATSIASRRFAFFDAWKVSKGRFWGLLGAFVLLWVMGIVGYLVLSFVAGMALVLGLGSQAGVLSQGGSPQVLFEAMAQPQILIPLVLAYGLMIIGAFVLMVAMFGINARAAALALEEGKITAAA